MLSEVRLKNFEIKKNKHTFYFNNHSKIFSLCLNFSLCHSKLFSLRLKIFPCVTAKFPVFSLSGKSKNQIPCFPCAAATLWVHSSKMGHLRTCHGQNDGWNNTHNRSIILINILSSQIRLAINKITRLDCVVVGSRCHR